MKYIYTYAITCTNICMRIVCMYVIQYICGADFLGYCGLRLLWHKCLVAAFNHMLSCHQDLHIVFYLFCFLNSTCKTLENKSRELLSKHQHIHSRIRQRNNATKISSFKDFILQKTTVSSLFVAKLILSIYISGI